MKRQKGLENLPEGFYIAHPGYYTPPSSFYVTKHPGGCKHCEHAWLKLLPEEREAYSAPPSKNAEKESELTPEMSEKVKDPVNVPLSTAQQTRVSPNPEESVPAYPGTPTGNAGTTEQSPELPSTDVVGDSDPDPAKESANQAIPVELSDPASGRAWVEYLHPRFREMGHCNSSQCKANDSECIQKKKICDECMRAIENTSRGFWICDLVTNKCGAYLGEEREILISSIFKKCQRHENTQKQWPSWVSELQEVCREDLLPPCHSSVDDWVAGQAIKAAAKQRERDNTYKDLTNDY